MEEGGTSVAARWIRELMNTANPNSANTANNSATTLAADQQLVLDFTFEQTLVSTPANLVNHLSLVLTGGTLPDWVHNRVTAALAALPANASALDRVRSAVIIIATSPTGAVQR